MFARTGMLDYRDAPKRVECWRTGPWTGRGADVSVVLDLMIHDLDLVHRLIPGGLGDVTARGIASHSRHPDDVTALIQFENGAEANLRASRVSSDRQRGMRAVYEDGTIEIDFMTREVKQFHQPRAATARGLRSAGRVGGVVRECGASGRQYAWCAPKKPAARSKPRF